jgi:hypothetical protein
MQQDMGNITANNEDLTNLQHEQPNSSDDTRQRQAKIFKIHSNMNITTHTLARQAFTV